MMRSRSKTEGWLRDTLRGGDSIDGKRLKELACDSGIKERTLYRAAQAIGVTMLPGGFGKPRRWHLCPTPGKGCHVDLRLRVIAGLSCDRSVQLRKKLVAALVDDRSGQWLILCSRAACAFRSGFSSPQFLTRSSNSISSLRRLLAIASNEPQNFRNW